MTRPISRHGDIRIIQTSLISTVSVSLPFNLRRPRHRLRLTNHDMHHDGLRSSLERNHLPLGEVLFIVVADVHLGAGLEVCCAAFVVRLLQLSKVSDLELSVFGLS